MKLHIDIQRFLLLPDNKIGELCFQPMVTFYQNSLFQLKSKDADTFKIAFYAMMTKGQKSLFLFYVFYNHAIKSLEDFYAFSHFFAESSTFTEIRESVKYFNNRTMYELLTKVDQLIKMEETIEIEGIISNEYVVLYKRFLKLSPKALERVGKKIRTDTTEFIIFS